MDRKRKTSRSYPGPPNLLTPEEIKQHRILIEDLSNQKLRVTDPERKSQIWRQLRNLRTELITHKQTRKSKRKAAEKTYKGAEF